MVEKFVNFNEF